MLCRTMRDLREIVCQSRLEYNKSDSESDVDGADSMASARSWNSPRATCARRTAFCIASADEWHNTSPDDSGIVPSLTRHSSSASDSEKSDISNFEFCNTSGSVAKEKHCSASLTTKPKTLGSKPLRLPPLKPRNKCSTFAPILSTNKIPDLCTVPSTPRAEDINFENIFNSVDVTFVATLLEETNNTVANLSKWCSDPANFVAFGHFWLTEFSGAERAALIQMEHGIFVDRLSTVFRPGYEIRSCHVSALAVAVFHEYPRRLLNASGSHLVLDLLDVIISSRRDEKFRKTLTSVHCSTTCREHTEIVLALRAFALSSILAAFVEFFKRLAVDTAGIIGMRVSEGEASSGESGCGVDAVSERRMSIAVSNGYTDIVHYLIKSGHVPADFVDSHQRSLVFLAVMYKKISVLRFLVTHVLCRKVVDVNRPADSGNSPLHVAASNGDLSLVDVLLLCETLDVNAVNPQSDGATALHLATLHGHKDVVQRLLAAGANPSLTAGGLTPVEIGDRDTNDFLLKMLS